MAVLPSADTNIQIDDNQPRRQGIGAWNPDVIGRATQQEGQGLERLGGTVGQVGDEIANQANQVQFSQATGVGHAATITARGQLASVTDPSQLISSDPTKPAPAMQDLNTKITDARNMISSPRGQALFDAQMAPVIANFGVEAQARGRELNNQNGLASYQQNSDTIINQAAALPDEAAGGHAMDSLKTQLAPLLASGAITQTQAVTLQKQAVEQFSEARYKYLLGQAEQTRDYTELNKFAGGMIAGFGPAAAGAVVPGGAGTGTVTQGAPGAATSPSGGPWVKGADGKTYATDGDGNVDTKVQPISAVPTAAPAPANPSGQSIKSTTGQAPGAYPALGGDTAHAQVGGSMAWEHQAPPPQGYGSINAPYNLPLDRKGPSGLSAADSFQILRAHGATTNEALVLTGAAANESGFNAQATHDHGTGYGMFGHKLDRLNLIGVPAQQQLVEALNELRQRPESAMVNAAQTPEQLANAEMHYEQPQGYSNAHPEDGHNYTGRLNTLKYFSQNLAQGVFTGSNGAPVSGARVAGPGPAGQLPGTSSLTGLGSVQPPVNIRVFNDNEPGTQVASLGPVGLPVAPPIGQGPATGMVDASAALGDISTSAGTRAPPQSQWPAGATGVMTNADGSLSYQMSNGSRPPVPGSRATGAPHSQLAPPPSNSVLSLLPPEKRAALQLQTIQEIQRMQREDVAANQRESTGDLASIQNSIKTMESGIPLGENAWAPSRAAYSNSADPQVRYNFAVADAVRNNLMRYQGAPPAAVAADISNLQSEYEKQINNPATSAQSGVLGQVITSSQNYLKAYEQGVAKDPLGRAAMAGAISGLKPLDPSSPTFGQDVADRVSQAQTAAQMFGQNVPTYLRPDDRIALRKIAQAGGDPMVSLAKGIVQGGGPQAYEMFKQIGKEAPPLAQIGQWALDPNADHTTQIQRYADYIQAMNDPKAAKELPKVTDQTMRASKIEDPLQDGAQAFSMDDVGRMRQTANILASESAFTGHYDPKNIIGLPPDLIPNAYNEAVGGTTDKDGTRFGGIAQVGGSWWRGAAGGYNTIVPTNMRQDKFETAIGQVNQSDVDAMGPPPFGGSGKLSAEDIKKGQFVSVPDKATGLFGGRYKVLIADPAQNNSMQPVLNNEGKPWIFDMNRAQQNGLGQRVPGAFMPQAAPLPPAAPGRGQFRNVKGINLSPDVASSDNAEPAPTEE